MDGPSQYCCVTYKQLKTCVINKSYSVNSIYRILGYVDTTSALNLAIVNNDVDFFEYLLANGSNPRFSTKNCEPPIFVAVRFRRFAMIETLVSYGAEVNVKYDLPTKHYDHYVDDNQPRYISEEVIHLAQLVTAIQGLIAGPSSSS